MMTAMTGGVQDIKIENKMTLVVFSFVFVT